MNPISNMPISISLAEGADKETKQKINKKPFLYLSDWELIVTAMNFAPNNDSTFGILIDENLG